MQVEVTQYRPGVACAAVLVRGDRDPERRFVLATAMAADRLVDNAQDIRGHLVGAARTLALALDDPDGAVTV